MIAVFLKARMLADHLRELEAVELRHTHVHEHDRDVVPAAECQRLARRLRLTRFSSSSAEHGLVGEQLRRLIVDQQDIDRSGSAFMVIAYRCSHIRNADSSCSVLTGFAR